MHDFLPQHFCSYLIYLDLSLFDVVSTCSTQSFASPNSPESPETRAGAVGLLTCRMLYRLGGPCPGLEGVAEQFVYRKVLKSTYCILLHPIASLTSLCSLNYSEIICAGLDGRQTLWQCSSVHQCIAPCSNYMAAVRRKNLAAILLPVAAWIRALQGTGVAALVSM